MAAPDCALYRPRAPQTTPLYRLVQARYVEVRDAWEEQFEGRCGFWRPLTDMAVGAYLDCGILDNGFARVRCGACRAEYLVAFSCKGHGLCPSCAAKRAVALAAFLREEVLAEVGHAQWVFSIPKMLRPYFLYHRPLLGRLCRAAYETAREMLGAALEPEGALTPGMIAVVQTFGDDLSWHPHVHALVTRGGWGRTGEWTPPPYVDGEAAAVVFRAKVFGFLRARGLLHPERARLLLSWRHTGFSVHTSVTVAENDRDGLERLAGYLLRPPVSLERLKVDEVAEAIGYTARLRSGYGPRPIAAPQDAQEFLARVMMHIPEPRLHVIRYYGAYSSVIRARRRREAASGAGAQRRPATPAAESPPEPDLRALRRRWAELISRIYEVDPLACPRCGASMRVAVPQVVLGVAFITDPRVVRKILRHLEVQSVDPRGPPRDGSGAA